SKRSRPTALAAGDCPRAGNSRARPRASARGRGTWRAVSFSKPHFEAQARNRDRTEPFAAGPCFLVERRVQELCHERNPARAAEQPAFLEPHVEAIECW